MRRLWRAWAQFWRQRGETDRLRDENTALRVQLEQSREDIVLLRQGWRAALTNVVEEYGLAVVDRDVKARALELAKTQLEAAADVVSRSGQIGRPASPPPPWRKDAS